MITTAPHPTDQRDQPVSLHADPLRRLLVARAHLEDLRAAGASSGRLATAHAELLRAGLAAHRAPA